MGRSTVFADTMYQPLFIYHLQCVGNYGETGWLGINEVLKSVQYDVIESSVAKMNEYYLNNADYDERLYTMCHEVSVSTAIALGGVDYYGMSSDDALSSPRHSK
jgi:hypothetical protein